MPMRGGGSAAGIRNRLGLGAPMGGGGFMAQMPSVGANYNVNAGGSVSATGPALVLAGLTVALVLHYIWTKGQQGGR